MSAFAPTKEERNVVFLNFKLMFNEPEIMINVDIESLMVGIPVRHIFYLLLIT